jgi:hypothetical protein
MRAMRAVGVCLLAVLAGCAGGSWGDGEARFVNRTGMAEVEFQSMAEQKWREAQAGLANQAIDLHAARPEMGSATVPPDGRAWQVAPRHVVVASRADVPAGVLNQLSNCTRCPYQDPTGIIDCGEGFCQAYLENLCTIVVPASRPENMGPYEMENCILWALGYDVSGR